MAKFYVTVERKITTVLEVEAPSAASARKIVADYGVIEAVSDMRVIDEGMVARVSSARDA